MKSILILLFSILFFSCDYGKKPKPIKTNIEKVTIDSSKVYNDVLNDLIKNYFPNKYIGEKWRHLYIKLIENKIDSSVYTSRINHFTSEIIEDDSIKRTLYINKHFKGYDIQHENLKILQDFDLKKVKSLIKEHNNFKSSDNFSCKYLKLKYLYERALDSIDTKFDAGTISFSKINFNDNQNLGIIYVETSEQKASEGSLLLIRKDRGFWIVEDKYVLWKT